jgi:hypothetical protein
MWRIIVMLYAACALPIHHFSERIEAADWSALLWMLWQLPNNDLSTAPQTLSDSCETTKCHSLGPILCW